MQALRERDETAADHREVERKYDVDAGFVAPDLTGVAGCTGRTEPVRLELAARYYDTADLRLAASKITLRRRTGGSDAGWTLKLPADGDARHEILIPFGEAERPPDAVPEQLLTLIAGHVRDRALVPVADLATTRVERDILGDADAVLAKLADDTVTGQRLAADGTPTARAIWREIEVELVTGGDHFLDAAGKHLRRHGAHGSTSPSKLARVLGDAVTPPPSPAAVHTAGDALSAYLRIQAARLLALDPVLRLTEHDDCVHQMRVTARSIYYTLHTHRRLLEPGRSDDLHTELRWLADQLGEVRDLEVQRARLTVSLAELTGPQPAPRWLTDLGVRESRARVRLRASMRTARYFTLLDALDAFIADLPLTPAADRPAAAEATQVVKAAWRKMVHAEAAVGDSPLGEQRDLALHTLRRTAKRGVFAATAATALGTVPADTVDRVAHLENLLGIYRDGVIAQYQLDRLAVDSSLTRGDAYTLGRLAGIEHGHGEQILTGLAAAWQQVAAYSGFSHRTLDRGHHHRRAAR